MPARDGPSTRPPRGYPIGVARSSIRLPTPAAGVIEDDVELAELPRGCLDHCSNVGLARDIGMRVYDGARMCGLERPSVLIVDVRGHHLGAFAREQFDGCLTDPARCPRDHRDFAG